MKFTCSQFIIVVLIVVLQACIGTDYLEDFILSENISKIEIETPSGTEVFVNQSFSLNVKFLDDEGNIVEGTRLSWLSTNPSVAAVDTSGLVTALQAGQTQIIVSANATLKDTLALTIVNNPNEVAQILIDSPKSQNTLLVGDTLSLQISLKNADDQSIQIQAGVNWISSNEEVISVNEQGQIEALQAGQAIIKAQLLNVESNEILFSVTNSVSDLSAIEISAPKNQLAIGESLQFTATARNGNGEPMNGFTFSWQSMDEEVLSIDQNGLAQGLKAGTAEVIALVDSFKSAPFQVNVIDPNQVTSLTISADANSINVGQTLQFNAIAKNALGNTITPAFGVIGWESSDNSLLTINQNGLGTALKEGIVQVNADAEGVKSNSITLSINPNDASRSGTFSNLNGYRVSGTATLKREGNNLVLEFGSDFSASNGPGLFVYLSNQSNGVAGGIELGRLQKQSGAQTYSVPSSVQLNQYNYVTIHCKPFNISFGNAKLN